MLDSATKTRIDSARDILVGKVPDPKSQVEQITIALIYKFMDDMDRQSEELGGKATFFAGEFKKYRWAQLLDKRYSGHERLLLYAEGIEKMNVNKNIPQLFRDIFKGVFLPYRDPETLNLFLKEINGFSYDHSERLGDAFEYLLSILGTQGDAGQFRTPRHIIDFIVAVVDPKKTETVLDPACGTAGFLISAFKHILRGTEPSPPTPLPEGEGNRHYRGGFAFAGLKERAQELRQTQTEAESLLWELLRDRQLVGAKFRRQHQFGDYICDFYSDEAKVVIECDGPVHDAPERRKADHQRDAYLRSQGLTVLRFDNDRVLNDTEAVLAKIASHLPSPSGRGAGGEGNLGFSRGAGGEGVASSDLTPDERARLMTNFRGYDIAPDMVRLARANLYLHGFPNPTIHEYDTLTSEERWDERCDVILANPPFMTPKGGVRPHNRFSIKAKRSEVLFVDYIAEHLNPGGRAGIIVPEGIIFQSQNAYKALRKMLVENYLWAVVSLPAGVFNPYAGVKTNILFLDRNLARQRDDVLFVKVENDGFDLGAQRRPIEKSDLPEALRILLEGRVPPRPVPVEGAVTPAPKTAGVEAGPPVIRVPRAHLLESPDINLSGDRYRVVAARHTGKWPMVKLGEVADVSAGDGAPQGNEHFAGGTIPFFRTSDVGKVHIAADLRESRDKLTKKVVIDRKLTIWPKTTILFPKSGASTFLNHRVMLGCPGVVSSHLATIVANAEKILPLFLFHLVCRIDAHSLTEDQNYPSLRLGDLERIEIPLPPLDEQERIVAELEGYQEEIRNYELRIKQCREKIATAIKKVWSGDED